METNEVGTSHILHLEYENNVNMVSILWVLWASALGKKESVETGEGTIVVSVCGS